MRVFRDKSSLSAYPARWPTIQQALDGSDFFLLLGSPETSNSKWVQRIAWLRRTGDTRTDIIGEKRIHERPQHQYCQTILTFQ